MEPKAWIYDYGDKAPMVSLMSPDDVRPVEHCVVTPLFMAEQVGEAVETERAKAADTIERLQAEIERLREALRTKG